MSDHTKEDIAILHSLIENREKMQLKKSLVLFVQECDEVHYIFSING